MNRSRKALFVFALTLVATIATSAPVTAADGGKAFIWPTSGKITQSFGCTGYIAEPRYGNCRPPDPTGPGRKVLISTDGAGGTPSEASGRPRAGCLRVATQSIDRADLVSNS